MFIPAILRTESITNANMNDTIRLIGGRERGLGRSAEKARKNEERKAGRGRERGESQTIQGVRLNNADSQGFLS